MPRLRRRQCSGDGGRRLAEERARPADLDRDQGAKLRRRRPEAERGSIDAEALELLCGEVDPVELVVDPDIPDEVRELEGDTEPRERLGLSSRAEDDGHDAADGRRAPVHVAVEVGPRRDANTATVDPHRPHVDAQLVEGKLEAETGVNERSDHRVIRRPCRQPAFELALPRVEGGEPRGGLQRAARAVDDLVRAAHEPVQRMDGGSNLGRKPQHREVVGGVVAAEQSPTRGVGRDGRLPGSGRRRV